MGVEGVILRKCEEARCSYMVLWRPTAILNECTYRVSGDDKWLEQRQYDYSFCWTKLTWKVFMFVVLSERVDCAHQQI